MLIVARGCVKQYSCPFTHFAAPAVPSMAPICGRLLRSRSPPQPNTQISRPLVNGRQALSALSRLSGVWA